jgi:peroxiredoxin
MNFQKKLIWILTAVILPLFFACAADSTSFEIVVKGGEHFPEGAKVVINRKRLDSIRKVEYIFNDSFKDNIISYKGQVDDIHLISLGVFTADEKQLSPVIYMALEPGKTEIDFTSKSDYRFTGGKYNNLLVTSVNNDAEYQKASKASLDYHNKGFDVKDEKAFKEYYRLAGVAAKIKNEIFAQAYQQQTDPLAKLLLHRAGYYIRNRDESMKARLELAKQLGDHREAVLTKLQIESAKKTYAKRASLDVGKVIKDFKAPNLEGEVIQLSEVLKKNKYVLVELWASWCKPCRAEIPHMKRAYEAFHKKGFEIVSFSIDDKRKAWEKASKEENIPWINSSDLKGSDSPVYIMFTQPAVPANWLVEASTGKIIAKHVRGKVLDHKLEELLK